MLSLFLVSIDIGGPNIASKLKNSLTQSNTHRTQIQIEGFFWPAAMDQCLRTYDEDLRAGFAKYSNGILLDLIGKIQLIVNILRMN